MPGDRRAAAAPGDLAPRARARCSGAVQSTSCRDLNNAWSSLDAVLPAADRFLQLRKLFGLGLVSGAQLLGCDISGIPAAIANPSPENHEEVFTGICNGLNPLAVDVRGNTPAG